MVNYDAILNLVSVVLIVLILFIIIFGCKSNGTHYYERFENKEETTTEEKKEETKKPELSIFENQILQQLSNGQLTTEAFTNLIATNKFTQENLDNMINYVETFKGIVNTEKK